MQTLKTAAIVVLLMTIIYAAYVSLTTPPEPLPPEVESMLVMTEEGDFSIDAGLPDSLSDISSGIESGSPDDALASLQTGATLEAPEVFAAESSPTLGPATDVPAGNAVTRTLSDAPPGASQIDGVASDPAALAAAVASLQASYPTTGSTFAMPDPNSSDVKFQPASSIKPSLPGSRDDVVIDPLESATATSPSVSAPPSVTAAGVDNGVANAIRTADQQFGKDKLSEALATLSLFYNTPNLSGEQRSDLLTRLDPLAREVIYSQRHLLEQPYRVGQNETLMQVAARFEVPWQLLANINQVKDPVTILPGTELKVVRGPFRAEVDLEQRELTLFLNDLYAGRFPIGVGNDPAPKPGTFTIQDKQKSRAFYGGNGAPIPPDSPNNPYGNMWLDLGGQLCIHGSPSTTNPTDKGCISLAADYADDLYGILSQGSSVTIRQ